MTIKSLKIFFLFIYFLLSTPILAQVITGKVISSKGGAELENVRVLNQQTGEETFSSSSGNFRINAGEIPFRLLLSLPGFENRTYTGTNTTELLIYLDPALESLGEVMIR